MEKQHCSTILYYNNFEKRIVNDMSEVNIDANLVKSEKKKGKFKD